MAKTLLIDGNTALAEIVDSGIEDGETLSSGDLGRIIEKLISEKKKIARREREEAKERKRLETEKRKREKEERHAAHVAEVTSMDLPLDWENAFFGDARADGVRADSPADGLILSLTNLGKVDIEYIAEISGTDCKKVIESLRGSIYQNPATWGECFYKGWETAEEYLSGHLMHKWKAAKEATKTYNGYFDDNVRAIEKVLPPAVATEDIYVTLGSPWVPTDVIDDFIEHLFGPENQNGCWDIDGKWLSAAEHFKKYLAVRHDEITGSWEVPNKNRYYHSFAVTDEYGTSRIEALHILERTLNQQSVVVKDEASCPSNKSGKKRIISQSETLLAQEKQKKLIAEFQSWVWADPQRAERLQIIFENNFGCVRRRTFDGRFLTFPTMAPTAQLYPYQKDAVARMIFSPNTLLAHDVGSGKTYEMVAAGMELKRMGLSSKNLYVVPNNIVGQWRDVFLELYPGANILVVEPRTFGPAMREAVLEDIRDNDYDGVIMAYSCFERIPLSISYYKKELEDKKAELKKLVKTPTKATNRATKKQEALDEAIAELNTALDDLYDGVYFDELGITRLFVDEAHNFKNVPLETKVKNVMGISPKGSKRCQDMLDKVRLVQKANKGGGVVMATGTPITNSITDAFVMQQYLQPGELALLDLQAFDSWVGMFAEQATNFEIDVDTSSYRMATRFSKFHNLPELTSLLSSIADFHQLDQGADLPKLDGRTDALIGKTQDFEDFLNDISHRADIVRCGAASRRDDNMLKITSDGRKAALDMRLVNPALPFTYQSKVARCAELVFDIYTRTHAQRSAQLVFCDTSTPKEGFNLYDELKDLLASMGMPESAIAFVHDAETEAERSRLFASVRAGDIRVLVGSTFKLGLGVNVQDRLIALHHLDVPWRPADMTQREGRILRQGNLNPTVRIFRYITEGSFDAYSWQLLETKQRFITELLSGSLTDRSGTDIADTALDYAEVKALAVGNPLVKHRVEVANELSRLRTLQRQLVESRSQMSQELLEMPGRLAHLEELIAQCGQDIAFCATKAGERVDPDSPEGKKERQQIRARIAKGISDNELAAKDRGLLVYRGFKVALPAHMMREKPFVWLERAGRYKVELGEVESGYLIRIDNYLDKLESRKNELCANLARLQERQEAIRAELSKDYDYGDQMEELLLELNRIDDELEVGK